MTNDKEETRNWTQLAAENKELWEQFEKAMDMIADLTAKLGLVHKAHKQLAKMRATIAEYERAHAVAEAMAQNNDVLRSVETSTYQTRGEDVDVEFGRFMFECGAYRMSIVCHDYTPLDEVFDKALEAWKANQK